MQSVFSWVHVPKRIVRTVLIIVPVPFTRNSLRVIKCPEQIRIQHRTAVTAVEPLYIAVLRRMTGLYIHQVNVIGLAPLLEYSGDELRTVVATYVLGLPRDPDDLFQYPNQSGRGEGNGDLLRKGRTVEIFYYVEDTELASAFQRVQNRFYKVAPASELMQERQTVRNLLRSLSLKLALKEADETLCWLELLHESDCINDDAFNSIYNDTEEVLKLLVSIIKSSNTKE